MTDTAPPTQDDNAEFHTDLAVGEILRRARVQLNIEPSQVMRDLRFKPYVVEALEQSDFDKIQGGQAYIIGFVRSYADYLGLDGQKLVVLLKQQRQVATTRPVYSFPKITTDRIVPPLWVMIGASVALLLILIFWSLISLSSTNTEIPDVPRDLVAQLTPPPKPVMKANPVVQNSITDQANTDAVISHSANANAVVIKAISDAWVDVRNSSGETVFSRVMKAGEDYWVPRTGGVHTLTAGNAGGIIVQKSGATGAASGTPLGAKGQVIRNYSLQ